MAQSNGDEKLREKVQDICDRVGAGLLPPTGAGAIMQLILADRKQHELDARIDTINEMADAHSGWNDGCDCCASEYMRSGWSGDSTWVTDRIAELNAERERLGN